MEATKEVKQLKDVLKFQLEFMVMMLNSGRTEEANSMMQRLFTSIERVEGDYHE
jgi:hypothetical protein